MILHDVSGKQGNDDIKIPKAFLLHREDFERIKVLGSDLQGCEASLDACEQRGIEEIKTPDFWDSTTGVVIKYGLTFVSGIGLTLGVAYLVP